MFNIFIPASRNINFRFFLATTALFTFVTAVFPAPALAIGNKTTPTGEKIINGTVSFSRPTDGRLDITQSTNRAIIEWDNFDTGKSAKTEFFQPGTSSLTVNRVTGTGNDPTQILGTLKANGNLMVLDRNGILFGNNSVVDVGGIIASTGDISNDSITGGGDQFSFSDFGEGAIDLRGKINVNGAGLAAFVSPVIRNSGLITARLGRVEMAAGGSKATVDLYGDNLIELAPNGVSEKALIEHSGKIRAEDGTVAMTAEFAKNLVDSAINLSGVVDVSSVSRNGGNIVLHGPSVNMTSANRLDSSSKARHGGGIDIILSHRAKIDGRLDSSGAGSGGDINITRGNGITLAKTTEIIANSANGKGGAIGIGAENGTAVIDGHITSSGAIGGGAINFENGDDPFIINETARVLSEGRDSGKGGAIDVSSAEGTHNIAGHLVTRGKNGGGHMTVSSRSGINIVDSGQIETIATGSGAGGNITLFVSEGQLNHNGRLVSNGVAKGGKILFRGDNDITLSDDSLISARSTGHGYGGEITLRSNNIDASGIIDASGQIKGGKVILAPQDTLLTRTSSRILSEGLSSSGAGGIIDLISDGTSIGGEISAKGKAKGGKVSLTGVGGVDIFSPSSIISVEATHSGTGGVIFVDSGFPLRIHGGTFRASGKEGGGKIQLLGDEDIEIADSVKMFAESVNSGKGGLIFMDGYRVDLAGSPMNVSGQNGGGNIIVNAIQDIALSGKMKADAKQSGNGGRVQLESQNGSVLFSGNISARGGAAAGNGGKVIFSTPNVIQPGSTVDVSAPNGSSGQFIR